MAYPLILLCYDKKSTNSVVQDRSKRMVNAGFVNVIVVVFVRKIGVVRKRINPNGLSEHYDDYVFGKQTLNQLKVRYKKSRNTFRKYFDRHNSVIGEMVSFTESINLVMGATFHNRSEGLLVFRVSKKNLYWKEIDGEKVRYYRDGLNDLLMIGFRFAAFTIDGRRGVKELLLQMFPKVPLQLCQFHQIQTVTKYLSRKPKLEAGKELHRITLTLTRTTEKVFINQLQRWYKKWCGFLRERTIDQISGRWHYTHDRVRSAYFSLKRNLPHLFICKRYPKLKIPNTTNSCDGSFAHWKSKVALHRGLAKKRRKKMINYLLENSSK